MMSYSLPRRRLIIGLLLTLNPIVFAGCHHIAQPRPISAQQGLIGKSETEVFACAGPPQTASSQDRVKVLTYQKSSGPLEGSFPGTKGSRPEGAKHSCTAILTLQDHRVIEV